MDTTVFVTGPERVRTRSPSAGSERACVLVVDDNSSNLLAMDALLRRDDLTIVTARSAREALEVLLERSVAVALIDVHMPEMDGIELAEVMRGVERTRNVPIIFVTASAADRARAFRGYDAGAVDYLYKPVDERVLCAKVDVFVALELQRRELAAALARADADRVAAERARAETQVLFHLSELTSRCVEPDELCEPALDAMRILLGAERASVTLFVPGRTPQLRSWRGLSEPFRAAVDGRWPWSQPASDPQPVMIGDVTCASYLDPYHAILAEERIAALAFVPLLNQSQQIGKFMLYWDRPREFSRHDENLAIAIASHVAQACERARMQSAATAARERLARLQRVTAALNDASTREAIGRECLPEIVDAVGAIAGSIYLLDEAGTELEAVHQIGCSPDDAARSRRVPTSTPSMLVAAVTQRELVCVESAAELERRYGVIAAQAPGASAVAPLLLADRVLGAVSLVFADVPAADDRRLLLAIADRCAHAIDRARLLELERKASAEAKRDIELNEMFVAILSHDLRNPLGSIRMASSLLAIEGVQQPEQRVMVERITLACDRMARMVEQLLDLTRSRLAGGLSVERRHCDLAAIVRGAAAELELAFPDQAFVIEGVPDADGCWDADRLAQVFSNLLGNAAIYGGPANPVTVVIDMDLGRARVRVHNGGRPIPANVLPRIFEPYIRGHRELEARGLGLGLYIASQIVGAHAGEIAVTSTESDGTMFTVTLPRSPEL